ncbi:FtsX-like permease family protein [Amycolatopsis jejuensis]|uniref:FtsX-like permease family protein n=1 Tax=Amycolatopsis jejuensis TaxID=330084 RepID=UPI00052453F1|nr:FtsX-like permease family protein [Amycolatopsis jejuensis]
MIRDLALGLRLAVGGGRMSGAALLRLAMTAFGIALAVAVLLPAASVGHLMDAKADRASAMRPDTGERPGVAPLLSYGWYPGSGDNEVHVLSIAATGPNSPVPPGLDRLPAPGELFVSPALAEKLASPEGGALRSRLPGQVAGEIAKAGVGDAGDLMAYAGTPVSVLEAEGPGADRVYAFGEPGEGFRLSALMLVLVAPIAAVLLLPLLIFVTTASRMGAAQRERRLAALRLVGVDAGQVKRIAAAESLVGAMLGLVVGGTLFFSLRPLIGQVHPFGVRVFADDFVPPWYFVLLIAVAVPALAVGSALFGLRRTIVEPLGVVRQGKPVRRRMGWRWAITAGGVVFLLATLLSDPGSGDKFSVLLLAAGSVLLLIGAAALLPWAVERIVGKLGGGPPSWQLAVRRLQLDSGTASRVVSGLVVVLAGTILTQVMITSLGDSRPASRPLPQAMVAAPVRVSTDTGHEADVRARLSGVDGLDRVHRVAQVLIKSEGRYVSARIGDCAALAVHADVGDCSNGDAFFVQADRYPVAVPSGTHRLTGVAVRGQYAEGAEWTVPAGLRVLPAEQGAPAAGGDLLLTPGALGGATLPPSKVEFYVGGAGGAQAVSDRVANAVGALQWHAEIGESNIYNEISGQDQHLVDTFRGVLLTAALFVLAVAAMSLLMLSIEQISERRRPLAALSAAGVPLGVLARGSLWQTAVPVVVGVVLAVAAGLGLTAPILRLANLPMVVDGGVLAALAGAAVVAVLLVTALTLPLLRQVTRLDTLRSE